MIIYTKQDINEKFIIKAINDKLHYNNRLNKLKDYYIGKQDIMLRSYSDLQKPNNKILINFCKDITDFLTSYLVGVPITYKNAPQVIKDVLNYNDNDSNNVDIVKSMNISGMGVELFYVDEDSIPRFNNIDPIEAIAIYDDKLSSELTHFIRVFPNDNKGDGYNVTLYTKDTQKNYHLSMAIGKLEFIGETINYWNDVPVIIYPNNNELQGSYEQLISLQDALNSIVSDEVNSFQSFVDAYLVLEGMKGTTAEDIAEMKSDKVLLTDSDSKAYWLTKEVNTEHIKQLKTDILDYIRELGKLIDFKDLGGLGVSGEAIKMKLIKTEIQASEQERVLTRGIQRKMELLYNVLSYNNDIGKYTDVKPVFKRNFLVEEEEDYNFPLREEDDYGG